MTRTPKQVWHEGWPFAFGAAVGAIAGWSAVVVMLTLILVVLAVALYAQRRGW